jgi:glycosyltransferase involved in cell wall biosynthesis
MNRVSVIIATHNRLADLRACLAAILRQKGDFELEVCIVNDGGASIEPVVAEYQNLAIRYLDLPVNRGQVAARNEALKLATGDYIALCDDDDRWLPDHVAALLERLKTDRAALAYTDCELVWVERSHHRWNVGRRASFAWRDANILLRKTNPIAPSSVLYPTENHERIDDFDVTMSHYWDWDFWLRTLEVGTITRVPRCLTLYGVYEDGSNLSSNSAEMSPALDKLIQKHGLGPLPSSNFWMMLEDDELKPYQAMTQTPWDGSADVWSGAAK